MKPWLNKTVGFKRDDPEDVELYEFSKTLPNFTVLVKRWLRHLKDGSPVDSRTDVPLEAPLSREITGPEVEVSEGQFLL